MNRTRILAVAGATALTCIAVAPAALAATYPPTSPTLAAGVCVGDIPYFAYEVDFGGEFVGDPMTITFVNPDGNDYVIDATVPEAGEAQAVLWPGAAEAPNEDWPGWELDSNGTWVETTDDAGAFTRAPEGVEVVFATNPSVSTSVTYPPSTESCANPATAVPTALSGGSGGGNEMPHTGGNAMPAILGAAALAVGGGLVVASKVRNKA